MLYQSIEETLGELRQVIARLDEKQYAGPSAALHGTSIGEHVRHIIEIFSCLTGQYEKGLIQYDKRERNKSIEKEKVIAIMHLDHLMGTLRKPDKPLLLVQEMQGQEIRMSTNYERELLYNLEHCIHHQALIRLALMQFSNIEVPQNFGIAPATIRYRSSMGGTA